MVRLSRPAAIAALCLASGALAQPANNNCASAELINLAVGETKSVEGTTAGATVDNAAGSCGSSTNTPDVWYRVIAPSNGLLTLSTCTGTTYNSVIAVKASCAATTTLACNDNACGSQSRVTLSVTSGTTYYVRVAGASLATGAFVLTVQHQGAPTPVLGPDVITAVIPDMLRHGTSVDGTVTAYSVGTTSCNPGDYPVLWIDNSNYLPDYDTTRHPVISQNIYRLKSYTAPGGGTYQRFEQLGQSWLKHGFLSTNSSGCGTCITSNVWRPSTQSYQNFGSDAIGVNCSDTYGASLNGTHTYLGAKSIVHPTLGTSPFVRNNGTGDATTKMRLQVPTADVTAQPAGTRFFADAFYVTADDAQFVRPGQTVATNALNNASYRELSAGSMGGTPTFVGNTMTQQPGIFAWKAADSTVTLVTADHDDTENPSTGFRDGNGNPAFPGTFIRSRFWVAGKATSLGNGLWRYEYAVYNHNSDRGAGTLSFNVPAGATVSDYFFRAPKYHSGEPYSNANWTMSKSGTTLTFSTEPYATNANANAIRWATLYNFGFTTDVAPVNGTAELGLFKPGTIPSITVAGLPVPTPPATCGPQDFNGDGDSGTDQDIEAFFACLGGNCCPSCWEGGADFNGDGDIGTDQDIEAFFRVLGGSPC
ncbi:MAG TPA: hypothetical protein VD997_15985 [Phycisphaerales bacterium]|nr:hypothetical protein [Phycisphaerales bacterium]